MPGRSLAESLVDVLDARPHGAAPYGLDQLIQGARAAFRLDLDRAVGAVPHHAGKSECPGLAGHEVAEAHALDAAMDQKVDADHDVPWLIAARGCSRSPRACQAGAVWRNGRGERI